MSVIVWVGLGKMGLPMASLLVAAGHQVRGVEINADIAASAHAAGIEIVADAHEAVTDADAVFTMLPTGDHVRELLLGSNGLFARSSEHTLFIDSSTIGAESARDLHQQAISASRRFVDAPVSGGVRKATDGTLVFMVGGSAENYALAATFIEPLSSKMVHTGGPGTGQAAKIANNMILGVCLAGTCEGFLLAERLGLDPKTFFEIAVSSSAENFALREWCPAPGVLEGAPSSHGYSPAFTSNLLLKDLSLALQAGDSTETALQTAHLVHGLFASIVADGFGDLDCTALLPVLGGQLQS